MKSLKPYPAYKTEADGSRFLKAIIPSRKATRDYQRRQSSCKTRRVNLRVTECDFSLAHARTREEGIPYQTLLPSVIYKYLSGRLVEEGWGGHPRLGREDCTLL